MKAYFWFSGTLDYIYYFDEDCEGVPYIEHGNPYYIYRIPDGNRHSWKFVEVEDITKVLSGSRKVKSKYGKLWAQNPECTNIDNTWISLAGEISEFPEDVLLNDIQNGYTRPFYLVDE